MIHEAETNLELAECLAELTPRQRKAVILRAVGYTYREIGEQMGISKPAAYYLIKRAREREVCADSRQ